MSTAILTRFLCDAPLCPATAVGEKSTAVPDGWVRLSSTAHIEPYRTPRFGKGSRQVSWSDRQHGSFSLHLCGAHPEAFAAHLPRTDGAPGTRGGDPSTAVSCSCGVRLGWVRSAHLVGDAVGPRRTTERTWWAHLPAELQWYALRNNAAVAS